MPIELIHSFLVHPAKNAEVQPDISGTQIPSEGRLYTMLTGVFNRSNEECNIEIIFQNTNEGEPRNECRDLIIAYLRQPNIPNGRAIARRLQQVSTHRSGLGLLFLMKGNRDANHQLVLSRFPADQGVIAQENEEELSVQFIERVFMKSAKAYKSALYSSDSFDRGFWVGNAVDRQISGSRELSDYWIQEFLASDLRTTGPAGTKRLAVALRDAVRSSEAPNIRQELISAASLLRNQHGRRLSARQIIQQIGLSDQAILALESEFTKPDLMDEMFQFDRDEFQSHVPYRAVELDNGGVLIAEDDQFNNVFQQDLINEENRHVRYVTEGRILNESLRKRK